MVRNRLHYEIGKYRMERQSKAGIFLYRKSA
ncbi:Uncharacterised protein [Vibrio cholerae]|uniref:Uncharacterized protein n=1 Tax=Vibrio cholerae TaxID=666 RepID=A0A655YA69_VIBCL|nr:Uncharacterised protein [Vibrio cholerae]